MDLHAAMTMMALALTSAACGAGPPSVVCGQARIPISSPCGPTTDLTPINRYQGDVASVQDREDAVALINGDCTGTLIAAEAGPVVLTAGHCVTRGNPVLVAFNVEAEPDGDRLVTQGTVIEQASLPDYALLRLDQLPAVTPTLLSGLPSDVLVIIQHPRGGPKAVAEGAELGECDGIVSYDVDTLVGSSGAGVLGRHGRLVAVHTEGNCAADGSGANLGWDIGAILHASSYLTPSDIHDR
jgi:hypothetical protein